ncbi:MAG: helix-hairpin-helix domain-containing protein, partial [Prevotellaceae bacterium]|nr:helix-hairpin-helix domain-containing protein [Prevotellaceae bacterium]
MKYVAFIFFCFAAGRMQAQNPNSDMPDALRQLIESVVADAGENEVDVQALYDAYESLLEFPLDLNAATEADLQRLQILTDFQIQSLLEYRKEYGALYTVHELPLIHGFNEEIAGQLYPFITVIPASAERHYSFADRFTRGRHQLVMRTGRTLEEQRGYAPVTPEEQENPHTHYLGSPWAIYTRYQYRYRDKAQWGVTAKNDAGEPFFSGNNKYGFDFYSAHVQLSDVGIVKTVIVGDYQMQFGQGLVAWGGYSMSKAGDVLAVKKQERGFTG